MRDVGTARAASSPHCALPSLVPMAPTLATEGDRILPHPDGAPCRTPRTPSHQSCPPKRAGSMLSSSDTIWAQCSRSPPHFEAAASAEIAATGTFRRHGAPCRELLIYSPGEEKSKPSSS